jgi:gamma-glutamylcyclotransferase (GGCT)/AIG2-like uncharacterized protein YtfP
MIDCLFVYGTLMRAAAGVAMGRNMRARLDMEGDWLGAASTGGRLYDLASYPGLFPSTRNGDRVRGEVYCLRDPSASLVWLDVYEGIPVGRTLSGDEYARVIAPITLTNGTQSDAWVYTLVTEPSATRLIPDGRWR